MPLLPYQRLLYKTLQEYKHLWIKKSRGLGVTTFFLYWIAYCCLAKFQPNDRVCIIVGPNIHSAEDLLARFKNLFTKIAPGLFEKSKSTVAIVNKVRVEVFPSHHVSAMRGLDRVRLILSDESDYYPPFQQKEVRAVVEGYIGKPNSDPHIIFVSTPAAPGGLMQTIELERNSLYHKHFFDYKYGLEGPQPIYSEKQLALARKSPDWSREYEGKYSGLIGNIYSTYSIERAKTLGQKYETYVNDPDLWRKDVPTVMALDPAWGLTCNASKYGVVISQFIDGKVAIIYAADYSKPDFSDMVSEIWRLHNKCGHISNIIVDSAKPEVISTLRREFRKDQYSEQVMRNIIADCKKYNTPIKNRLFVVPKSFAVEGRQMLQHSVMLMDDPDGLVAIPSISRH